MDKLKSFKSFLKKIEKKATNKNRYEKRLPYRLKSMFIKRMNNDLDVREAFDGLYKIISRIDIEKLDPGEASGIVRTLREIDGVLQVIF